VTLFVADASVAVKWILRGPDEPLVAQARDILLRQTEGKIQVAVPDLFWVELGNVVWKAVRCGRCTRLTAEAGLSEVRQHGLLTVASRALLDAALEIAFRYDRTVYDSIYVALAVESRAQLITADEKLANATAAYLPVKWLGAW